MKKANIIKAIPFLILFVTTLIFLIPFIWTSLTSLKLDKEIYTNSMIIFPSQIYFGHYVKLFTNMDNFTMYFYNSVVITFFSVSATVLFSAMMGYAFGVLKFAGKKIYLFFILLILTLPYAIYLIPIYILEDAANLIDTRIAIILPYIALNLPLSILIMRGTFKNIPTELVESATIDGCNFIQAWSRIMMPIAKSGIAIVIILTFINSWGEFMFARTLSFTPNSQTLSVGITFLRDEASSWQYGTLCSAITVALIPLLIIFLSMQKYFIKGIVEGALKG